MYKTKKDSVSTVQSPSSFRVPSVHYPVYSLVFPAATDNQEVSEPYDKTQKKNNSESGIYVSDQPTDDSYDDYNR